MPPVTVVPPLLAIPKELSTFIKFNGDPGCPGKSYVAYVSLFTVEFNNSKGMLPADVVPVGLI